VRFVALDVETANPDMSSICQIGIVHFEDGKAVDSWSTLIDPKDYFDGMNVSIHGIDEDDVRGAPDFKQASAEVRRRVANQIVAIHTAFDRNAIARASLRHEVDAPECFWLNTASVARRAWPEGAQKGYGLSALSEKFGIEFEHHNAVEDARAAGLILVRAMTEANLDLVGWLDRVKRPLGANGSDSMARDGNPEGSLFGDRRVHRSARHSTARSGGYGGQSRMRDRRRSDQTQPCWSLATWTYGCSTATRRATSTARPRS
jgi:DNA polymerase-3 subunit epsilon